MRVCSSVCTCPVGGCRNCAFVLTEREQIIKNTKEKKILVFDMIISLNSNEMLQQMLRKRKLKEKYIAKIIPFA